MTESRRISKEHFSVMEASHVIAVLEDCVDQLIILGGVMPVTLREKANSLQIVDQELANLVESQKAAEANFAPADQLPGSQKHSKVSSVPWKLSTIYSKQSTAGELRRSTQAFSLAVRQNPLANDNIDKIQTDRAFLESVFRGTMMELKRSRTFTTLLKAVEKEQEKQTKLEDTIRSEEDSRNMVKQLQRRLIEVKKEREAELQKRNEMIAHLKDQLQEMKAKTNMEGKYVKNITEVSVTQTQKRLTMEEERIRNEIQTIKKKIDDENRVNAEIESFLRTHIQKRQDLLQLWIDKHETEVDMKQRELDLLKAAKAKDFERLQELKRLYNEYEQVVIEDRVEKERLRQKADQEADEQEAAVMIQAWWRGLMVRRCLGPFKKKKKKKGKGKGKGKKGEKDKKKKR